MQMHFLPFNFVRTTVKNLIAYQKHCIFLDSLIYSIKMLLRIDEQPSGLVTPYAFGGV